MISRNDVSQFFFEKSYCTIKSIHKSIQLLVFSVKNYNLAFFIQKSFITRYASKFPRITLSRCSYLEVYYPAHCIIVHDSISRTETYQKPSSLPPSGILNNPTKSRRNRVWRLFTKVHGTSSYTLQLLQR